MFPKYTTDKLLSIKETSYKLSVTRYSTGSVTGQKWRKMCRFTVNLNNAKYPLSFIVNTPTSRDFITLQWNNADLEHTDIYYAYYRNLIEGTDRQYVYERVSNTIYDLYTYIGRYEQIEISDLYRPIWEGSISCEWIWEAGTPSSPINLKRFLDYKTASEENINTIFTN